MIKPRHPYRHALVLVFLLSTIFFEWGCASTSNPRLERVSEYSFTDRMVIGMVELSNRSGEAELDSLNRGIGDLLINELMKYRRFRIVEREKTHAIISELKLQHSGMIKDSDVIEVGHHLGADALLFVAIDSVDHKTHTNHGGLAYTKYKKTEVTLSARLVSVESNELLLSSMATARKKQRKSVALGFAKSGDISDDKESVEGVLKVAIVELANKIAYQAPKMQELNRN